ncbi:tetratricopeptide repeat protein [Thermodesulfobacteriota bacterium]
MIDKVSLRRIIEDRLFNLHGNSFQDFCDRFCSKLHPGDYTPVRAGGGDDKNDGYCPKARIFFAAHATRGETIYRTKDKIQGDLKGCLEKHRDVNKWIYLTNDTLVGKVETFVDDLRKTNGKLTIETWGHKKITDKILEFDIEQIKEIIEISTLSFGTLFVNVSPYNQNLFTGRKKILEKLHKNLKPGGKAALTQPQAISGLGGIGKTQIAIRYTHEYRKDYSGGIMWITADTEDNILSGFAKIARELGIPEKADVKATAAEVTHRLHERSRWLLIFDNVDDPAMVKQYMPNPLTGAVLVTSRKEDLSKFDITKPIKVGIMSSTEAEGFLKKRTGREKLKSDEEAALKKIAKELGYFPLALEQAGGFIYSKKRSFKEFLSEYKNARSGVALIEGNEYLSSEYGYTVLTTWSMNFKAVKEKSEAAADILNVSAFLAPDKIPFDIFTKGASKLDDNISNKINNTFTLKDELKHLSDYSLISYQYDSDTFDIHRLVQEVIRHKLGDADKNRWAERTVAALSSIYPEPQEFIVWETCEKLTPHALVCYDLIKEHKIVNETSARLLYRTGWYLDERALYSESEKMYILSKEMLEDMKLDKTSSYADILNNLATLYKYDKAEPLYKQALKILKKAGPKDAPNYAATLHNLGLIYYEQGNYTEAMQLFKQSLDIKEQTYLNDTSDYAATLNGIANIYRDKGEHDKAEPLYKQALEIHKKTGQIHSYAATLHNLALLKYNEKKYEEAQKHIVECLNIMEEILPKHPKTAKSFIHYSKILTALGRMDEAKECEMRAAEIMGT